MPKVNLYTNYSDANVAVKNLSVIEEEVNIKYKEPCSVENPVITFDRSKVWKNVNDFNYFYLPDTKRYYFVSELTIEHGFVTVKGTTDVLSSFWSYVKSKQCYINRQQNVYSAYAVDDLYPVYNTRDILIQTVPCDFFNGNTIVLTVTGGV